MTRTLQNYSVSNFQICNTVSFTTGFPGGSDSKEFACNAEDLGLIPQLGRSPGVGQPTPLQDSCLENSIDRVAQKASVNGVTKSWTRLSNFHSLTLLTIVTVLYITPPGHFITGNLYLVIPFTHSKLPSLKTKAKNTFICLSWVLVAMCRIFNLHGSMQDPVPWPGIKPRPPTLGAQS